jgi:glucose-6-phosphate isomerase, archaeal
MEKGKITTSPVSLDITSGQLSGAPIMQSYKKIADLKDVFKDETLRSKLPQDKLVYIVQAWMPEEEGTPGGLYFGTTIIHPGKVGDEYFMTRGHFHARRETGEFYWGIKGSGILILMDEKRNVRAEEMKQGSLHYINHYIAHRVANIGSEPLVFNACWPSDAGHDYDEISNNGFAARLVEKEGKPFFLDENEG